MSKISQKALKNPRIAAVKLLAEVLDEGKSMANSTALSRLKDSRDYAFARHLTYGVLRWFSALDWLAAELLSKPLKRRDIDIQRLLLSGLQQLWQNQSASHAAVNETAECARVLGKPWAVGLLNAVLRRFQREQEAWLKRLSEVNEQFAHPAWLLHDIKQEWPDQWQDIANANNLQAPLWLRINRLRADEAQLYNMLQKAGFEISRHPYAGDAIAIDPAVPVGKIPGFETGWLSVQDPAAQLARDLIDPQSGDRILDACAAPGGKTAHLLESCTQLDITVIEKTDSRDELIKQNFERLCLETKTRIADAINTNVWWDGKPFNKILLDAPCSATGVIRRHPEIKWLRTREQVMAVTQTQADLLAALWPLLEGGGMLVYATCSILNCENTLQIERFLQKHKDALIEIPQVGWGVELANGRQILPGEAQMDGFFYAILRKSAD